MVVAGTGAGRQRLLSCRSDDSGGHFSMVDADGGRLLDVALPGRGQSPRRRPDAAFRAAVFARRPGTFAWIVDLAGGQVSLGSPQRPAGTSTDTTVHSRRRATAVQRERLCPRRRRDRVYDASDSYRRRLGELPSHGVGPTRSGYCDGRTLVIANGDPYPPDLPRCQGRTWRACVPPAYVDAASGGRYCTGTNPRAMAPAEHPPYRCVTRRPGRGGDAVRR